MTKHLSSETSENTPGEVSPRCTSFTRSKTLTLFVLEIVSFINWKCLWTSQCSRVKRTHDVSPGRNAASKIINVSAQPNPNRPFLNPKYLLHWWIIHPYKNPEEAWPVWLSWMGIVQQSEMSPLRCPVRAHAWVAGSVSGGSACERWPVDVSLPWMFLSLSFSPTPLSLKN